MDWINHLLLYSTIYSLNYSKSCLKRLRNGFNHVKRTIELIFIINATCFLMIIDKCNFIFFKNHSCTNMYFFCYLFSACMKREKNYKVNFSKLEKVVLKLRIQVVVEENMIWNSYKGKGDPTTQVEGTKQNTQKGKKCIRTPP